MAHHSLTALSVPPRFPPRVGKYFRAERIDLKTPELFRVASVKDLLTILFATTTGNGYGYDKRGVCRVKASIRSSTVLQLECWGPRGGRDSRISRYPLLDPEDPWQEIGLGPDLLPLVWLATKLKKDTPALVQLAITALMKPV